MRKDKSMNTENASTASTTSPCQASSGFPTIIPLPSPLSPLPSPLPVPVPVLHLINGEHYAGAERVQDLLAKCLPEFGFSVGFACLKLDVFDAMRESRDAPLFNVPMAMRFDLRAARRVVGIIRQGDYRLLHCHSVRTALIGAIAARRAGVPMVYHVHSPASQDSTRRWMDRINGFVQRLSLRGASRAIAVSQAMADHVVGEGFDPARVTMVSNGVPGLATLPSRAEPVGCWTLGMVALFRPRKGLEVLLEAMAILRQRGIPVQLRAVGTFESPKYEAEIAARVRQLQLSEHVLWTGFTRHVAVELARMDLLVLPSSFGEGLPMVVLEAMAAGVPVVASRVPGVPEAIRHGQDGILTEPNDPAGLAQAIADVIDGRYNWATLRASAFPTTRRAFLRPCDGRECGCGL